MARQHAEIPERFRLGVRADITNSALTTEEISFIVLGNPEQWSRRTRCMVLSEHAACQGAIALELQKREALHQGALPAGVEHLNKTKFSGLYKGLIIWENAAETSYEKKYFRRLADLNNLRNEFMHSGAEDTVSIEPTELIKTCLISADAFLYIAFECSPIG